MNRIRPGYRPRGPRLQAKAVRRVAVIVLAIAAGPLDAAQFVINGPVGSGEFGRAVTILPNGNIVVVDPGYDAPGPLGDVGAVYLYRPDGALISTLRGSQANDRVGGGGVVVLANGHFVVVSPSWDNGAAADAGAVTFVPAASGLGGVVSPANSLVGSSPDDRVGELGVTTLPNGNYLVRSPAWDNGPQGDAGAVTFAPGTTGLSGAVSPVNSLVGGSGGDQIGISPVTVLANGNYVVASWSWSNGALSNAGAVTFGSGTTGVVGPVTAVNSLVGGSAFAGIGSRGIVALANGNYVVASPFWRNGTQGSAGAVTFGSGTTGIQGVVSSANSLVGTSASDLVGVDVIALPNGNYVVASEAWDNGPVEDAGAVTFGSGTTGVTGPVSPANSLVGTSPFDRVGRPRDVTVLANGNYVVRTPSWDNGVLANAGAVTFASGTVGIVGPVAPSNSLVGGSAEDRIGNIGVTPLANGNYVVASSLWDNGMASDAGAATFGVGTTGVVGVVSSANSLVGVSSFDQVASMGVVALANGNYVVASPSWDDGATRDAGAATFAPGSTGITGPVSSANSLVGTSATDLVGSVVTALPNGNYVVSSPLWDDGTIVDAGAVTFGSGNSGIAGAVSPANSLVGGSPSDRVGGSGVTALVDGDFVVQSQSWDNGTAVDAGAVTFASGTAGIIGLPTPANSLVGGASDDRLGDVPVLALPNGNFIVNAPRWDNGGFFNAGAVTLGLSDGSVTGSVSSTHAVLGLVANQGTSQVFDYDPSRNQLAVGQPAANRVVLHRTGTATSTSIVGATPDPSRIGEPVTFTATVVASPAPSDGRVTFTASSGEQCVDGSPMPTSATTADFSCTIVFATPGARSIVAEYTGSVIHAYSGSGLEPHSAVAESVFADGFETP